MNGQTVLKLISAIATLSLLFGCAGFGVVKTSDPDIKLNDAAVLYEEQNRPLIAERLIFEAIAIYRQRNDYRGLGAAYRTYGNLLRSGAVEYSKNYYVKNGFRDKTVTFETRFDEAHGYFAKAIHFYQLAENTYKISDKYDALTNVYYNLAWLSRFQDEHEESCKYFDLAMEAYETNIQKNPDVEPQHAARFSSLPEQIKAEKKRVGCGHS